MAAPVEDSAGSVNKEEVVGTSFVHLRDGSRMPIIGTGTYVGDETGHTSARDCLGLVTAALAAGFTHFDGAMMYQNERELGEALRGGASTVPADLFVTTKVAHPNDVARGHTACSYMDDPNCDAVQGVLDNVRDCAERLALGRPIDLVLLHWPGLFDSSDESFNEGKRWDMWQGLEKAKEEGLCVSIGTSSFSIKHLQDLLARGPKILPAVNQIEVNPLHRNWDLTDFCQQNGIQVCAWSPFGIGNGLKSQALVDVAAKHGRSPAAVVLKWLIQRGIVPLPRSVNPGRLKENYANATDPEFTLSDDDLAAVDALDEGKSVFPHIPVIP